MPSPRSLAALLALALPAVAAATTYHGPARASVTYGGKHASFHDGSCQRKSDYLTVNIGRTRKGPYFGTTVGKTPFGGTPARHDGTYSKNVVISFITGGKSYAVGRPKLTLRGNRTRGTFTGTLLTGRKVSGSFHC
jgi:hypothetical protein